MAPDFEFVSADGFWLLAPTSREAACYLRDMVGRDHFWIGESLVVDHQDVVNGTLDSLAGRLENDGFRVWV